MPDPALGGGGGGGASSSSNPNSADSSFNTDRLGGRGSLLYLGRNFSYLKKLDHENIF
jgi:hypothetical protein